MYRNLITSSFREILTFRSLGTIFFGKFPSSCSSSFFGFGNIFVLVVDLSNGRAERNDFSFLSLYSTFLCCSARAPYHYYHHRLASLSPSLSHFPARPSSSVAFPFYSQSLCSTPPIPNLLVFVAPLATQFPYCLLLYFSPIYSYIRILFHSDTYHRKHYGRVYRGRSRRG